MGILVVDRSERKDRSRVIIVGSDSILQCSMRENGDPNSVDTEHSSRVVANIRTNIGVERIVLFDETSPDNSCFDKGQSVAKKITALMMGDVETVDLTDGRMENYYEAPKVQGSEPPKEKKPFTGAPK